jgi:NAD(P)-dependent dehydrogenase (short-subunit alcohol dehydrogenase family)
MSAAHTPATVIVGAAGALGEAITRRLASEGHDLVLAGRDLDKLQALAQQLPSARAIACDVTKDDDVTALAQQVGPTRMLVFTPAAPTAGGIDAAPIEAILTAVNVKVGGLLRLLRALQPAPQAAPQTASTDRPAAVVIGGNLAYDPIPHAATSGIANAAQANAVRQLEHSASPWRIHVIAPGPVATERWEQLAEAEAQTRGVSVEQVRTEATAASPLGRLTSTEEVAWTVSMLADPHAAALHGSTLLLDTGRRTAIP